MSPIVSSGIIPYQEVTWVYLKPIVKVILLKLSAIAVRDALNNYTTVKVKRNEIELAMPCLHNHPRYAAQIFPHHCSSIVRITCYRTRFLFPLCPNAQVHY